MKLVAALFSDNFIPNMNSTTVAVKNYAYWLNKKYGKSIVVTPNENHYLDVEEFDVLRYKKMREITNNLKDLNINIVHAHSPFNSLKFAYEFAKANQIPIVGTLHNKDYEEYFLKKDVFAKITIKKLINLYNKLDKLFVPSTSILEDLKLLGFKNNIELLENGSDFVKGESNREYVNHKHEISDDTRVLLYVGKLSWQNNLKLLMDTLINLRKLKQDFRMFFVGDGNARDEMLKIINENKLTKYVIFTGVISDRNLLKRYYERADLLLFPQVKDTVGQAIIEASSFKIPTLIVKDASLVRKIKDYNNGYLSENNGLSYAQKIIASLNDKNIKEVGLQAQNTLVTSYEKVVDQLYQKYSEIIK